MPSTQPIIDWDNVASLIPLNSAGSSGSSAQQLLNGGASPTLLPSDTPIEQVKGLPTPSRSGCDTVPAAQFLADLPQSNDLEVIKRDGTLVRFDPIKIGQALIKAYCAVESSRQLAQHTSEKIRRFTIQVAQDLIRRAATHRQIHIEDIQDKVELVLMREGEHQVARKYVLYREQRAHEREQKNARQSQCFTVRNNDGTRSTITETELTSIVRQAVDGIEAVDSGHIVTQAIKSLHNDIQENALFDALRLATTPLIEEEPNYSMVVARLLQRKLWRESARQLGIEIPQSRQQQHVAYPNAFLQAILYGIQNKQLNPSLATFDLVRLSRALHPERDDLFRDQGLQILYDRYLLHQQGNRYELPQIFFMRVAMGLALQEKDREHHAIEFYNLLSSFDYLASTPTLFNAGTRHPQLSSCYISTVGDDLGNIFESIQDNAMLSKWAGGLGNDWTPVRANGAWIQGTNGKSNGVLPFLKVANSTTHAVNQGGKRKGALCVYLEVWHYDIEFFIEMRKNTGDERLRAHEMNIAAWIPDLFMQRVEADGEWSLFSPDEVPELHDLYGLDFTERYERYEQSAKEGKLRLHKTIAAKNLWRNILAMLFETGHPWITFKDPCNIRSPQSHVGVIHSSNLCTEITLNTSRDEIAVCNLGSVNLANHLNSEGLNPKKIAQTVKIAMRMLDNVIDINYYAVEKARNANLRHRPVGLGIMGFQDALYQLDVSYEDEKAIQFADQAMEIISYHAILASSDLAKERGVYESYDDSLWSQGILPIDSLRRLAQHRPEADLEMDTTTTLDWAKLRHKVKQQGMRNSNVTAIAPTATIARIAGVYSSIDPLHGNIYVEQNLSGNFVTPNRYLVAELKSAGLWDKAMVHDLKYYHGSVQQINRIPERLRKKYRTSFEMDMRWIIEAASRRQKWIDQSQSVNLFFSEPKGSYIDSIYRLAWRKGLKTTYYLRSIGSSTVEQSTTKGGHRRHVQLGVGDKNESLQGTSSTADTFVPVCNLGEECTVCQ